jgi:hypothetical protein
LRIAVFERDGGRCRYCRLAQMGQVATFHINHVVPRSRGGQTTLPNLVLQCPWCSLHKSDKVTAADPQTGAEAALFHPLENAWSEHFDVREGATLFGRTPVGRATIGALRMNDPLPRAARSLQLLLGLD